MAQISINIDGADIAGELLAAAAGKIRSGIQTGLAEAGEIVVGEAKAEAPVKTGDLRKSINKSVSGNECIVGTNCEYAAYQEFGTYKNRPRPFLVPALINNKDNIVNAIKNNIT